MKKHILSTIPLIKSFLNSKRINFRFLFPQEQGSGMWILFYILHCFLPRHYFLIKQSPSHASTKIPKGIYLQQLVEY